jgi:predicted amidophosphoribosyltransferase
VYDDIFTDGQTLNEVARALRYSGRAKLVSGITLARQPWRK